MSNFGLSELRIVAPRDGWPNFQASAMAAHATPIIDAAKIYPNTEEAVADLEVVYATCCRMRDMQKPVLNPRELMPTLNPAHRIGILFGPERTGLENPDMARAAAHIYIPVNPEYQSLNLAQAVAIIAYEWFTTQSLPSPEPTEPPAPQGELEGMLGHLEKLLTDANFYQVPHKKPKMDQNIRNIFARNALTHQKYKPCAAYLKHWRRKKIDNHLNLAIFHASF